MKRRSQDEDSNLSTETGQLHRAGTMPQGLNTSMTLEQLEAQPLRVLICQDIGTRYLMPLALETLETDPLTEGKYYPGDLLSAAMKIGADYWDSHKVERERLLRAAAVAGRRIAEASESIAPDRQLRRDIEKFIGSRDT